MGEQVTIQIRIDSDLREEAAKVFDGLGLDLSSGIRMYLKAVAREQGIPFNTYLKSETSRKPSRMEQEIEQIMRAVTYQEPEGNTENTITLYPLGFDGLPPVKMYIQLLMRVPAGKITRWEDMKAQLSAGLNFSVSGIPWWTMDIGGFSVEKRFMAAQHIWNTQGVETPDMREWRELNARWHQFGAFCPLYRTHGQWPLREVWNIAPEGHPAYESILYYHRLRYRLMPYIYSLAAMTHFDDYTLMRPLVMDYPADTTARKVSDQFFFGPALMAAPVFDYGARQRNVYMPEGTWYDFYTGKKAESGTANAPYERIPLFVRSGSILPVGPAIEYTDEKPADLITLYEDEGTNYNYEKGLFATIPLRYDDASHVLTIGKRKGTFPGMLQQRRLRVVYVDGAEPCFFGPDGNNGIMVDYDGLEKRIRVKNEE